MAIRTRIGQWLRSIGLAGSGKEPALRQTGRLVLTARHELHRVEHGGEVLLVATHPGGVTLLTAGREQTRAQGAG